MKEFLITFELNAIKFLLLPYFLEKIYQLYKVVPHKSNNIILMIIIYYE